MESSNASGSNNQLTIATNTRGPKKNFTLDADEFLTDFREGIALATIAI